jgi:hypothetical protein
MRTLLLILWLFAVVGASAHQNSIAYLFLDQTNSILKARWEIPVRDLEFTVGLDANKDGEVTWGEIREHTAMLRDYAFKRLALRSDSNSIPLALTDLQFNKRPAGAMVVLFWQAPLPDRTPVTLEYNFGFDYDGGHQCILSFQNRTAVLTKDRRTFEALGVPASLAASFPNFVRIGVLHIFEGIDHICFLLALMLPAVWRRTERGWEAVGTFQAAFISIAKIVTAFTVAHSITLAIAALRIVVLPSAFVESVIAFSVVVAALNNLWPLWTDRSWMVAFGFGLIHGFGFASALADLPAGAASLAISLAGFNIGVEIGQLCIVLVFLPLAFLLRESWFYRWCAVRAGSIGIASVAAVWLVERAFQISIF